MDAGGGGDRCCVRDSCASGNRGEGRRLPLPTIAVPPSSFLSPVSLSSFPGKHIHQPALKEAQDPGVDSMESPLPRMPGEGVTGVASVIPAQAGIVGRGGGFPIPPLPPHLPPSSVLSRLRHSQASASISPALKEAQDPGVDSMGSPLPWMPGRGGGSGVAP